MLPDLLDPPEHGANEDDAPPIPAQRRSLRVPVLATGAVAAFAASIGAPEQMKPWLDTATTVAGLYATASAIWQREERDEE